jgi:Spy/CpxP family protein refolding chaperone
MTLIRKTGTTILLATLLAGGGLYAQGAMQPGKKMQKKMKSSPFLIKRGMPHLTGLLMKSWDDPRLALTPEQKEKLLVVRKETIGAVKALKPQVMTLKKEIVQAGRAGEDPAGLKAKVEKLAALEAEATMAHLKCLHDTRKILKPEQYDYLIEKAKTMRKNKMAKIKGAMQ